MKEGDKLICKIPVHGVGVLFTVGKEYEINSIEDSFLLGDKITYFNIYDDVGFIVDFTSNISIRYLYDYFYTKKEIRMIKLKIIEGENGGFYEGDMYDLLKEIKLKKQ